MPSSKEARLISIAQYLHAKETAANKLGYSASVTYKDIYQDLGYSQQAVNLTIKRQFPEYFTYNKQTQRISLSGANPHNIPLVNPEVKQRRNARATRELESATFKADHIESGMWLLTQQETRYEMISDHFKMYRIHRLVIALQKTPTKTKGNKTEGEKLFWEASNIRNALTVILEVMTAVDPVARLKELVPDYDGEKHKATQSYFRGMQFDDAS